jgi:hypothetical protein
MNSDPPSPEGATYFGSDRGMVGDGAALQGADIILIPRLTQGAEAVK